MAEQISTLNGVKIIDDSGDPGVPILTATGTAGAALKHNMGILASARSPFVVDTVAALQALEAPYLIDGQVYQTLRYSSSHTVGDGSGNSYRYVDADATTADGGFVLSHADGRFHACDRSFVDVRKFGAGTSVLAATNDASLAAAASTANSSGLRIYVPDGVYPTSDTWEITAPAYLDMETGAEISLSGNGTALSLVGSTGTDDTRRNRKYSIGRIVHADGVDWDAGTDTTSVGVKIDGGFVGNTFEISCVRQFVKGVHCPGLSAHMQSCIFMLGDLLNNQNGLVLESSATGYCNQNTFIGGRILADSAYDNETSKCIVIDSYDNIETNGHTFIGINLESTVATRMIDCEGDGNTFINCRYESAVAGSIYFASGAQDNRILGTAGGTELTFFGGSEIVDNDDAADNSHYNIIESNTYQGTLAFCRNYSQILMGDGSTAPTATIGPYGSDRVSVLKGIRATGVTHYVDQVVTAANTTLAPTANIVRLNYSGAQDIVNIAPAIGSGVSCQITLISIGSAATLKHGTGNIVTHTGADVAMTTNKPYTIIHTGGTAYLQDAP
jgi:hypothetical protein